MIRRLAGPACLAFALALGACFGGDAPPKPPGSALWIDPQSGELDAATQNRLAALGLREIFLEAAELSWDGGPHLGERTWARVPRRTPTTLVISGAWRPGDRGAEKTAEALEPVLRSLRIEAEQEGLLPVGVHFRVAPGEQGEHYAKTLRALRKAFAGQLFVSSQLDRRQLAAPETREIAEACDFVVSFLYGQRPGEPEDPSAWDLTAVERNFQLLDGLGRPYLVGAVTVGSATWRGKDGGAKANTTELALGELLRVRGLELQPGFSLEGIDRQVWEFGTRSGAMVGGWKLAPGERVRVVRTATSYVEELRRRVGAWESPRRLGEVFYRLPRPEERLSLSAENLEDVLSPSPARPALAIGLEVLARSERRWTVRLRLENQSSENTEISFLDNNYAELSVADATIGEVDPGEFQRFELYFGEETHTMRALRNADRVRLYLPLLEGGQEAVSGAINLRPTSGATPHVATRALFLLPDGRQLELAPQGWELDQ